MTITVTSTKPITDYASGEVLSTERYTPDGVDFPDYTKHELILSTDGTISIQSEGEPEDSE